MRLLMLMNILKEESELSVWSSRKSAYAALERPICFVSHLQLRILSPPEYLIVEPTGVGYLSNVISNISQIEYEQVEMLTDYYYRSK